MMNPSPDFSPRHPATPTILSALQVRAPAAAEAVAPYLDGLLYAQDAGHSFVCVGKVQAAVLKKARPVVGDGSEATPLVLQGNRLYSGRLFACEREIAEQLYRLSRSPVKLPESGYIAQRLCEWFPDPASQEQKAAAALALLQPFIWISGGPGTGKTTTVAKLLALLCGEAAPLPRIALAAPTGKAAAHMTRSLHRALATFSVSDAVRAHLDALEGQTVHRLLRLHPLDATPKYDAEQSLPYDIVILDEASMLDFSLLLKILRAVPEGGRLILLGDEEQLPPVGIGALLPALAQPTGLSRAQAEVLSAWLPEGIPFAVNDEPPPLSAHVVKLTRSHRFDPERGVGALAQAIVSGLPEQAVAAFSHFENDLCWQTSPLPQLAKAFFVQQQTYWAAVAEGDPAACLAAQQHCVVLTALRADAEAFNQEYRRLLVKAGKAGQAGWFAGQILMAAENDYAVNIFNGDIGIVLPHGGGLAAFFPHGTGYRPVALSRLPLCDTAFAMTVHKSQGSEYKRVWLVPPQAPSAQAAALFDRTLLYTAVTRAKKTFVYAGDAEGLKQAVARKSVRHSGLKEAIAKQFAQADKA
ncbi:MAG: exodeoxyribonuclease V subunit alpha [Eikenella sp.]|nr:exodeoxyribonuclease V subunit alpha [Eikenella sp.]